MASDPDDDLYQKMYRATQLPHQTSKPLPRLTLGEVIELAKAGVPVKLDDVDLAPTPPRDFWNSDRNHYLMVALMQRINQAFPLDMHAMGGRFRHMSLAPSRDDKVAVLVVTAHGNAALIEDERRMFPSDTFIASLILMIETEEKSNGASGIDAAQVGAQATGYASAGRSPTYAPPQSVPNQGHVGGQRPAYSP